MPAIYNDPRIIVALDFPDAGQALEFTARLDPAACRLKVGFELFVSAGPALVEKLVAAGFDVFLDLKFHDIPNTVASACRAAAQLGVWMMNVHASGGGRMLQAAREALDGQSHRPRLIAVTVLTSMDERDLDELGLGKDVGRLAEALAGLAAASGLDGVVCSASEAPMLRQRHGEDFLLVAPGDDTGRGHPRRIELPGGGPSHHPCRGAHGGAGGHERGDPWGAFAFRVMPDRLSFVPTMQSGRFGMTKDRHGNRKEA